MKKSYFNSFPQSFIQASYKRPSNMSVQTRIHPRTGPGHQKLVILCAVTESGCPWRTCSGLFRVLMAPCLHAGILVESDARKENPAVSALGRGRCGWPTDLAETERRYRTGGIRRWSTGDNRNISKQNGSEFSGSWNFQHNRGTFRVVVGRETYIRVWTQTETVGNARDSYVSRVTCIYIYIHINIRVHTCVLGIWVTRESVYYLYTHRERRFKGSSSRPSILDSASQTNGGRRVVRH